MKFKNSVFIIIAACAMVGCASHLDNTMTKKPPRNAPSDDATIKLAEAADSVSDSLLELAKIQAAATPAVRDNLPAPQSYAMQTRASVDWTGPVEPLLRKIALASHYRVRALGKEPAIPVLVSISVKDETLGDILRNLDFQVQADYKAHIVVYPNHKTIELRYAKA